MSIIFKINKINALKHEIAMLLSPVITFEQQNINLIPE